MNGDPFPIHSHSQHLFNGSCMCPVYLQYYLPATKHHTQQAVLVVYLHYSRIHNVHYLLPLYQLWLYHGSGFHENCYHSIWKILLMCWISRVCTIWFSKKNPVSSHLLWAGQDVFLLVVLNVYYSGILSVGITQMWLTTKIWLQFCLLFKHCTPEARVGGMLT